MKEEQLERQLATERDQVRLRDTRIDSLQAEIGAGRKQCEDYKLSLSEMETLRGELAQKFDDLRFDC